jgi:hypothetical protein
MFIHYWITLDVNVLHVTMNGELSFICENESFFFFTLDIRTNLYSF